MLRRARACSVGPLAVIVLAAVVGCSAPKKSVTAPGSGVAADAKYAPSDDVIANPERGFYRDQGRCDHDDFNPATVHSYRDQQITLVLCDFYLSTASTISKQQLTQFSDQANALRTAGAKMILRFAYTDTNAHDATPAVVQSHLDQLADSLREHRDVIAVVQSGFVGQYGEGWFTDNFGNTGNVSEQNWTDRKEIVDGLLTILPERMVQVRTVQMKQTMYGPRPVTATDGPGPANPSNAYSTNHVARVGLHNDCFLHDPTDVGTYRNPPGPDMAYLNLDSRYVPVGGETCGVGEPPARTACSNAKAEMERFHYSYLNRDKPDVIDQVWMPGGCKPDIDKRLGYRLELAGSLFPASVKRGSTFLAQIGIKNTGWAAPINSRPAILVMRHMTSGQVSKLQFAGADPRRWQPVPPYPVLAQHFGIPDFMATGDYELLLSLPDPSPRLSTKADYAIRLATDGVWEPTTGFNNLLTTIKVE